jgi:hypothetical protein
MQEDMEITFCIPKPWGDEDQSFLKIIGMNSTPVVWRDVNWEYVNIHSIKRECLIVTNILL